MDDIYSEVNEECFSKGYLDFAGDKQWFNYYTGMLTHDMETMTIHLKISIYSQERDLILTPMNGRKKML